MKISIRYIFLIMMVAGLASCKKYLDVNTNPNSPTTPPINGLLTRVTQNTGMNVFRVSNITSYYVQYLASPNPSSPTDVYEPIDASTTWTNLYDNMTDIYDLKTMAATQGAKQYEGVANILMSIHLQMIHSLWGGAPYNTAFSGETLTPTFESPQAIFERSLSLLDEAITLLQATNSTRTIPVASGTSPRADLIHNGSSAAWIRTANALKARLLNQLSKTPQYNPTAILDAVSKAYTSNAHDAFITAFAVRNPWNQVALNNSNLVLDGWLSAHFVNSMTGALYGVADPRLPLIASQTRFNDYRGTRNGAGRVGSGTNRDESYISLTGYYSSPNSPLFIMTFEEVKFIEAEAALRSNNRTRAYNAYIDAIRANMTKMGIASTAIEAYVTNPAVAVGAANLTLELIFREKYKALFLMPVIWDDARRLNYPGFQLPQNVVTNTFVRRLVYPSVEESRNGANVPKITDVTQRFWWDQ
jgi:hypothetical protein